MRHSPSLADSLRRGFEEAKANGGAKRIRTADPMHAMHVLYQLSYSPKNLNFNNHILGEMAQKRKGLALDRRQSVGNRFH